MSYKQKSGLEVKTNENTISNSITSFVPELVFRISGRDEAEKGFGLIKDKAFVYKGENALYVHFYTTERGVDFLGIPYRDLMLNRAIFRVRTQRGEIPGTESASLELTRFLFEDYFKG